MRLFEMIQSATIDNDSEAIWDLILEFEPFILKVSRTSETGTLDEDLISYIHTKLHKRIKNFDMFKDQ